MEVVRKLILSPHESGRYKSFPTVAKAGESIIVAYREGKVEPSTPHGVDGCVKMLISSNLTVWRNFDLPFCNDEMDSILSYDSESGFLFLATRRYSYASAHESFLSRFTPGRVPSSRTPVYVEGFSPIFFGHIIRNGRELLAPAYSVAEWAFSPVVLFSSDNGLSWSLKSFIGRNHTPILNETSIVRTKRGFIAIMRSLEPSFDLYFAETDDPLHWHDIKSMGILGHAPVCGRLYDGRVAFVFRDLNGDRPGISIALQASDDLKEWDIFNIATYSGDIYNGGYADFVELKPGLLCVVYYISDSRNEPWIECAVVDVKNRGIPV